MKGPLRTRGAAPALCDSGASHGLTRKLARAAARRAPAPDTTRKATAEGVGTFILVFFAVGSAVFGIDQIGPVGVAFAFGLMLLALAYSIGPVSGCHVNPAVTLGVLLRRGITTGEAGAYWIAQVVGAIVAAAVLKLTVSSFGGVTDQTGGLGTNDYGKTVALGDALLIERFSSPFSSSSSSCS